MVARLWWKDARMFWPIWVFLMVVAAGTQMLTLSIYGKEARDGFLIALAVGWTCLYAMAVAAASLAGERETRTLALLDALGVARWRLWAAKASFAVVTTLLLGIVLLSLAAMSSDRFKLGNLDVAWGIVAWAAILLTVLGWGLLWSAFLNNALTAAALAVFAMGLSLPVVDAAFPSAPTTEQMWIVLFALGLLAMIASAVLFIRQQPPEKSLLRRARSRTAMPAATRREAIAEQQAEVVHAGNASMPRLAWQAIRQVRRGLWWMIPIALFVPAYLSLFYSAGDNTIYWTVFLAGATIVAGVNLFGHENAARTHRFLAHHGARPALVWLTRIAVGGGALGLLLYLAALAPRVVGGPSVDRTPFQVMAFALFLALAISVLCGMVFRRSITAGLVSVLLTFGIALPVHSLAGRGMMPTWVNGAGPILLLLASFLWTREWMLDRPGAAKWLRLGALILVPFTMLFAGYATDRAFNLPAMDRGWEASIFAFGSPRQVPPGENAAELYHQAGRALTPSPEGEIDLDRWNEEIPPEFKTWARDNFKVLELVRQAASKHLCRFVPLEELSRFPTRTHDALPLHRLASLVTITAREELAGGDLDGAWSDITILLKMANHWGGANPLNHAWVGLNAEKRALGLATVWAVDDRQTPERLHSALATYQGISAPNAADSIRVEAMIFDGITRLPHEEVVDYTLGLAGLKSANMNVVSALWAEVTTTPWELARTRRAFRLLFARRINETQEEPWRSGLGLAPVDRWTNLPVHPKAVRSDQAHTLQEDLESSTPLLRASPTIVEPFVRTHWRNEVDRRALVQVLALRIWQLSHDGSLPDRLEDLVARGLLGALPADPYNPGKPFSYTRSDGPSLPPPGAFEQANDGKVEQVKRPTETGGLLYTIGAIGLEGRYRLPAMGPRPTPTRPDEAGSR